MTIELQREFVKVVTQIGEPLGALNDTVEVVSPSLVLPNSSTSSDGTDLGVFHANIFEAAIQARTPVQPVTLRYANSLTGLQDDTVLFVGNTTLASSLRKVMASSSIKATVHFGASILPQGHKRKSLAVQAQHSIRQQLRLTHQGLT